MSGASGLRTKKLGQRTPCVDGSSKRIITRSESLLIQCNRGCAAKNRVGITHRLVISEVYNKTEVYKNSYPATEMHGIRSHCNFFFFREKNLELLNGPF